MWTQVVATGAHRVEIGENYSWRTNTLEQETRERLELSQSDHTSRCSAGKEFLKRLNLTRHKLALDIRVPPGRIGLIVEGKRGVTADTALRLARYFGTSPEFWLNLQLTYDLSKAKAELRKAIEREVNAMVG